MACLPHELIVWEILVRLPAKSLLRLQCVCKAWRATISGAGGPSFSEAHLGRLRLHQQGKKPCSLLIAPCIQSKGEAEHRKVATPGLYLWEVSRQGVATLLHDTSSFPTNKRSATSQGLAHCDGLLLMPTDDTVHVLNPATRQVLKLPWSSNSVAPRRPYLVDDGCHQAFGFGRAHGSNTYTVARFFHRQTRSAIAMDGLGMEVLIIGKDQYWRETSKQPSHPFVAGRTATFFKGSLVWTVDHHSLMYHDNLPCFVRFTLEDESFSVIKGPPWYQGHNYFGSGLAELNGELAMPRRWPNGYGSVEIWTCDDVQGDKWEQRYAFKLFVSGCPIATFDDEIVCQVGSFLLHQPFSQGNIMVNMNALKYYNADMSKVVEYSRATVEIFDVTFFIPTLVQI